MEVRKSDGLIEEYSRDKVKKGIEEAYAKAGEKRDNPAIKEILEVVESEIYDGITSGEIREIVERELSCKNYKVAKEYILYWDKQENIKEFVLQKEDFIEKYKRSKNNADATVDDNSNAAGKNVSLLNAEIHKKDNILISRSMITRKLKEMYPTFNSRNYVKDLEHHIIYKHDESSFAGPIAPYCVSISMYPFILGGTKAIGGTSEAPKNLAGYCGSFCNLLFAIASQYAGACMYKDQSLLISENGVANKCTSKALVEKYLTGNPKTFENYQGVWEYSVCPEGVKVLEDGKLVDVKKVYRRKYSDNIYKITTKDGYTALVSKDHIFKQLLQGRELDVKAEQLEVNDTVFLNKDYSPILDFDSKDFKRGWIAGMMCGDGSLTQKDAVSLSVNYEQEYLGEIFNDYLKELYGYELNKNNGHKCFNYAKHNRELKGLVHADIIGDTAYDKHIRVEDKSLSYLSGFLDGLFCADGSYVESRGIVISLTNKALAENIREIVSIFGLPKKELTVVKPRGNGKEAYQQYISSRILKYLKHVHNKCLKRGCKNIKDSSRETYYYGYNAFQGRHKTNKRMRICDANQEKEYKTDIIVSIEKFKNDDAYVYEIETSSHWYNCGGFITHNCAVPEFLLFFDWFARKEWGDDYYLHVDECVSCGPAKRKKTIRSEIEQHFQGVIYSINSPASSRNSQSPFTNFSYFDKPFFESMFENFRFPDGTEPIWESLNWLQKEFMMWFNAEREKTILTFPVESFALIYKDGEFVDKDSADFVAAELARGHSFFVYISDTADSLSSCCFGKAQKVLWKSSTAGVNLTTLEELYNIKWEPYKKNLRIFHNGSWVKGKAIKLENRPMYKVVTENNKEMLMTDNHINVTLDGEKATEELTTSDYLMFNILPLNAVPENDENLTYEQGFVIGAFLGDGSMGSEVDGTIYDVNFSQNKDKYEKMMNYVDIANKQIGGENSSCLSGIFNNVYPVRICSKKLVAFIKKWTNWERGTYAYNKELNLNALLQSTEFRRGILDGWYNTDGGNSNRCYTTSPKLAECMEVLITSLGMQSVIDISDKTNEPCVIRGIEYNRNYPLYCVRWYEPSNHRKNKDKENTWIKKNNSMYFKIKSIEKIDYVDDVYCIECSNHDEPYFTLPNGLITHNCRLKNKIQTKEFSFTNGNIGVETGSKSVITLNLNRITQDFCRKEFLTRPKFVEFSNDNKEKFKAYLTKILGRVYKYHTAYNEYLWDMYDAGLLPVYKAGFIDLNKQYLTVGINGLNQAAEFLGLKCSKNDDYKDFCGYIFSIFEEENNKHKTKRTNFNLEFVPAESLAIKNYNWDKEDGYWVPEDTNLYASYVFKPNENDSVLDRLYMMSNHFAMDKMSGGAAAHINLDSHLSKAQYEHLLKYCGEIGCSYWTVNVPNSECECGFITKHPITECPKCGSKNITYYDRVIGYLTKVNDWSEGRRKEQKTRVYTPKESMDF